MKTTLPRRAMIRTAGFYECSHIGLLKLLSAEHALGMLKDIDAAVRGAGYTLMPDSDLHGYSDPPDPEHGYSYRAYIGESGIDIHTWPEFASVQVVVHTCSEDEKYYTGAYWKFVESLRAYYGARTSLEGPTSFLPLQLSEGNDQRIIRGPKTAE